MNDESKKNPFDENNDPDRHFIWQRLVAADSEAFIRSDWSAVAGDFDAEHFEGVRCAHSSDPDDWRVAFPRLDDYRDAWLEAAREFARKQFIGMTALDAVYRRTRLNFIDIAGDRALAHKKFSGIIALADGSALSGERQTIYRLHKQGSLWKIVGFFGQLPLEEIKPRMQTDGHG